MSFFVNASREETFQLIMDYLNGRQMKILTSDSPSHIRAAFGSWLSMGLDDEKGELEARMAKRNGGSFVNLSFSFSNLYMVSLTAAIVGALIVYAVLFWNGNAVASTIANAQLREDYLTRVGMVNLAAALGFFVCVIGLVGYAAQRTRKRVTEEFNMFIQSLAARTA